MRALRGEDSLKTWARSLSPPRPVPPRYVYCLTHKGPRPKTQARQALRGTAGPFKSRYRTVTTGKPVEPTKRRMLDDQAARGSAPRTSSRTTLTTYGHGETLYDRGAGAVPLAARVWGPGIQRRMCSGGLILSSEDGVTYKVVPKYPPPPNALEQGIPHFVTHSQGAAWFTHSANKLTRLLQLRTCNPLRQEARDSGQTL
jgi:hypothetical protein